MLLNSSGGKEKTCLGLLIFMFVVVVVVLFVSLFSFFFLRVGCMGVILSLAAPAPQPTPRLRHTRASLCGSGRGLHWNTSHFYRVKTINVWPNGLDCSFSLYLILWRHFTAWMWLIRFKFRWRAYKYKGREWRRWANLGDVNTEIRAETFCDTQ